MLAAHEGCVDDVTSTKEDLIGSLFCNDPLAFCEIALWNGRAAGFAIWYYSYSIFLGRNGLWLEDLFVDESFRRRGVGQALFEHLARHCIRKDLGRLEWSVLKANEMAIQFYKKMSPALDDSRLKLRLTEKQIRSLAIEQLVRCRVSDEGIGAA
jgi:GNAT superfamily N-acetyltransferase